MKDNNYNLVFKHSIFQHKTVLPGLRSHKKMTQEKNSAFLHIQILITCPKNIISYPSSIIKEKLTYLTDGRRKRIVKMCNGASNSHCLICINTQNEASEEQFMTSATTTQQ
jgi:hypothetical protein